MTELKCEICGKTSTKEDAEALVDARRVFKAMGEFWARETPELCKSCSHYTADRIEICECLDFEETKGED